MTFASLNSNRTGVASGAVAVYLSGAPEFILGFLWVRVTQSLVACV